MSADGFLKELVHDASRANRAENDLHDLKERVESFNVEIPNPSELGGLMNPVAYQEGVAREVAKQLGRMVMAHPRAVQRTKQPDGSTRYVLNVVLTKA